MKNSILVVEDDPSISKLIYINLFAAGYDVEVIDDGLDAERALIEGKRYDLALLDIMLPGKSGLELLPEFTKREVPVILLTAKSDVVTKVEGLKGGAEDYIVKPFEVLELLVRIEKVLKRYHKMNDILQCGEVSIDIPQRSVHIGETEISLKPMEFDLLLVLAQNQNIALSRQQLLNMVWGEDYLGETRTVDVHVGQLRKKLQGKINIRTISKIGYRLED